MRIIIKKIGYENNMTVVEGITNIGTIKGIWKDKDAPVLGNIYFVELNIGELHKNHVSIISDRIEQSRVYLKDEMVFFIGWCEDIDDVYFIRFTDDWIEMIEIVDNDIAIKKDDGILFRQKYDLIWIYPY